MYILPGWDWTSGHTCRWWFDPSCKVSCRCILSVFGICFEFGCYRNIFSACFWDSLRSFYKTCSGSCFDWGCCGCRQTFCCSWSIWRCWCSCFLAQCGSHSPRQTSRYSSDFCPCWASGFCWNCACTKSWKSPLVYLGFSSRGSPRSFEPARSSIEDTRFLCRFWICRPRLAGGSICFSFSDIYSLFFARSRCWPDFQAVDLGEHIFWPHASFYFSYLIHSHNYSRYRDPRRFHRFRIRLL